MKQILHSHPAFDPAALFRLLDRAHKGHLIVEDVRQLSARNGLAFTDSECLLAITAAGGGAGILTYSEYIVKTSLLDF